MMLANPEVANRLKANIETVYLYASRRGVTVPAIYSLADALKLLKKDYKGKLYNLLENRFALTNDYLREKGISNSYVELPANLDHIESIVTQHFEKIAQNAYKERGYYSKYLESIGLTSGNENVAVSDLGYSGSIQKALSKLLNTSLSGYYFVTCFNVEEGDELGNKFHGFFAEKENPMFTESPVYKYSLVLESLLTAPDGQFLAFADNSGDVSPIFQKTNGHFTSLTETHNGMKAYCSDMLKFFAPYILDFQHDKRAAEYLFAELLNKK